MRASVAKWGNSLAIRIPKSIATATDLTHGSNVDLHVDENGAIVLTPSKPRHQLSELLADYDPERHRHAEIDTGPVTGGEVW